MRSVVRPRMPASASWSRARCAVALETSCCAATVSIVSIDSAIVGLVSFFGGVSWLAVTLTPAVLIFDAPAILPVLLFSGSMFFG